MELSYYLIIEHWRSRHMHYLVAFTKEVIDSPVVSMASMTLTSEAYPNGMHVYTDQDVFGNIVMYANLTVFVALHKYLYLL